MNIVKLGALNNGAHENRESENITAVPDGWAMIPEDFHVPDSFPFVTIEAAAVEHWREVEDNDGKTKRVPVTLMTVTGMTALPVPESPEPEPQLTTAERVSALEEQLAESDAVALALYEAQVEQETVIAEHDEAILGIYEMIGG